MPLSERSPSWKKFAARRMRKNPTPAEAALWSAIKGSKLGVRFKRQVRILGYIADFYCPALALVIEVDGPYHNPTKDAKRDQRLLNHGFITIRFSNHQVLTSPQHVLQSLSATVSDLSNFQNEFSTGSHPIRRVGFQKFLDSSHQ